MKKKELIKIISGKTGIRKKVCKAVFDNVFERILILLCEKRYVRIENFGEFKVKRKRTEVKLNRENIKTVIPPEDIIVFKYTMNSEVSGKYDIIDKNLNWFINDISETEHISIDSAGKIYCVIFESMNECFDRKKNIEISSFGRFIVRKKSESGTGREEKVLFIPSGKVSGKINYNFSNLNASAYPVSGENIILRNNEFEFMISEEFKKTYLENSESGNEIIKEETETAESSDSGFRKKLISAELIRLHKEITEREVKHRSDNSGL
ncbi:MAG: HU family DNA-binding protein [Ignavibacteria bacterium]|nr:HU family DNA-binding protein [Ignavibacteria bacterium]